MTRIQHNGMALQIGGSALSIPTESGYQVTLKASIAAYINWSVTVTISVNGDEKVSITGTGGTTDEAIVNMNLGDDIDYTVSSNHTVIELDGVEPGKGWDPSVLDSYDGSFTTFEVIAHNSDT